MIDNNLFILHQFNFALDLVFFG